MESVDITSIYFLNNKCANITPQLFNEYHQDKHVGKMYVVELVKRIQEMKNIANKKQEIKKVYIE